MVDHRAIELTRAAAQQGLSLCSARRLEQLLPALIMAAKRSAVAGFTL
jgi:hypothetical protein